ncbi:hypothetical protein EV284_3483 [Streptomyces sp. BK022]|uniref:hypothetical protein n=1 Tax=Streptomyces sp. BK022 TaxID=2512123 RepID=UPI001029EA9C|nr:hypothetical protein [Streptomyces sp. BK022]RZU36000.1 hypothetical protein EV284_3483 [Streptomyces sp. BK022]
MSRMDKQREARLRNAVARLINAGLRQAPVSDDDPVSADDLFVWEIVKVVRNSALNEARDAVDRLRIRD